MSSDQHGHSHGPGEQCHGHGAAGDAHGHGHGGAPDMLPAGLLPGGGVPPQVAQMVAMLGPEQRAALQARMMQMMAANKSASGPPGAPGVPNPEMMSQVMKLMSQGNMMSGASPFGGGPPGLGGPPGMGGPPNPAMMAQMAQMMQARGQHGHGHGGPPGMGSQPTPAMMAQMAQMMQARMAQQGPPLAGPSSSSSSSSSSSTEIVSKADGQSRYAHSVLDSSTDVNTATPAASPMEYSARLYEPSPQDEAPIITAAKRGDVKEMDRLLQDDPDFDMTVTDEQGNTALHWAVYGGHLEASSWLITSGSPLDPTNKIANATPLHWACTAGNIRIVQLLVKSGADINAVDAKGYNALIHATHYNDGMLVYYLQRQGLPIDSTDNLGHTPLHWAAYLGHSRLVQMILSLGANIDKTDSTGNTALHLAASKGAVEAIEVLLTRGANHTIRNNNNQTADEHAERSGFFSTAEVLRTRAHHLRSLSTTTGQRNQSALWFTVGFSFVMTLIYLFTNFPAWFAFSLSFMLFYLAKVSLQHKRPSTFSGDTLGIGIAHALFLLTFYAFFSFISPHLEWFEGIGFALLFGGTYFLFNFVAYVKDPGFIPRTSRNTIHAVLENIEKGGRVPQYCMVNMIAKPLRAEYSPATGRCVARYDHHSTWLNKPIGWLNYRHYLSLCILLTVLHFWFIRVASILLFSYENGPEAWRPFGTSFWFFSHVAPFVFFMVLVNGGLLVWRLLGLYAIYSSIKSNMTTNEVNNSRSINYMKGPGNTLFNPFLRRTFKENFADFWRGNFNYLHIYFVTEEEFGSSLRLAAVQSPV